MKLLLDEMYAARLAEALHAAGIATRHAVLTENVADFARLAADHSTAGVHHSGMVIALSSRFSRRPDGTRPLVAATHALADEQLDDRVVYLRPAGTCSAAV